MRPILWILTSVVGAGLALLAVNHPPAQAPVPAAAPPSLSSNVQMMDGKQIIEISAKGGYSPDLTVAKANTPTVIRVKTDQTFDCSAVLTIPSLGYRGHLPMSGYTQIDVPPQPADGKLQGVCAMGMYDFAIQFVN